MQVTAIDVLLSAKSKAVQPKDADRRVWELVGHGRRVDGIRDALLACLIATYPQVFICYDEAHTRDSKLAPHLVQIDMGCFRIAGSPPIALLREWLYLGNWQMMSPRLAENREDLVRAKPVEIISFVDLHQLDFVIDSFHDDAPWVVAFGRNAALRQSSSA